MLAQRLIHLLAEVFVVLKGLDFSYTAKGLESAVIEFVDLGDVRICYYDVWKRLHVSDSMCQSITMLDIIHCSREESAVASWGVLFEHSLQSLSGATLLSSVQRP